MPEMLRLQMAKKIAAVDGHDTDARWNTLSEPLKKVYLGYADASLSAFSFWLGYPSKL